MVLLMSLLLSKSSAPTAALPHPCHGCTRRLTGVKDDTGEKIMLHKPAQSWKETST